MFISINIDTSLPLSVEDRAILSAIADVDGEGTPQAAPVKEPGVVVQMADRKREQEAQEEAPAKPAKKAAAPRKKAAAPKAPEPEPQDAEEDLVGSEEDPKEQAVDRATEAVAAGKGKAVKAALAAVDGDKVRNLTDEQAVAFLEALDEAGA